MDTRPVESSVISQLVERFRKSAPTNQKDRKMLDKEKFWWITNDSAENHSFNISQTTDDIVNHQSVESLSVGTLDLNQSRLNESVESVDESDEFDLVFHRCQSLISSFKSIPVVAITNTNRIKDHHSLQEGEANIVDRGDGVADACNVRENAESSPLCHSSHEDEKETLETITPTTLPIPQVPSIVNDSVDSNTSLFQYYVSSDDEDEHLSSPKEPIVGIASERVMGAPISPQKTFLDDLSSSGDWPMSQSVAEELVRPYLAADTELQSLWESLCRVRLLIKQCE